MQEKIDGVDSPRLRLAQRSACEVAEAHGLIFEQAIVPQNLSNVIIHLAPTPVVARVSTTTGTVRVGDAWFAREVEVARHLTAAGVPIIPLSSAINPGLHQHSGSVSSAGGYTLQKPLKRAYEQDPQALKAWLETDYPAIEQQAKTEAAEIAWGDESGLRSDTQVGCGYAPRGQTLEIQLNMLPIHCLCCLNNRIAGVA